MITANPKKKQYEIQEQQMTTRGSGELIQSSSSKISHVKFESINFRKQVSDLITAQEEAKSEFSRMQNSSARWV